MEHFSVTMHSSDRQAQENTCRRFLEYYGCALPLYTSCWEGIYPPTWLRHEDAQRLQFACMSITKPKVCHTEVWNLGK